MTPVPERLSEPQRRHLRAMIGKDGLTLYWHPANSGERRCARVLRSKGLLSGSDVSLNSAYELTDRGMEVARTLQTCGAIHLPTGAVCTLPKGHAYPHGNPSGTWR